MPETLEAIIAASINLASPRLGSEVASATDEFFGAKERMLQDSEAVFIADKYDDHGKWMDGWETRRRRDGGRDHAIVRLGAAGLLKAASIETTHFTGNYPPAVSLEACHSENEPGADAEWFEILAPHALGPDASHLVKLEAAHQPANWVRVTMFPDGGIARLRLYGEVVKDWSSADPTEVIELSALQNGGRIIGYNNAHYGDTWALLSAGRGKTMGDGWETRRRRRPGHDWIVLELGHPGVMESFEIDTAHFKGNYPDQASVCGAFVEKSTDDAILTEAMFWQPILPEVKLGPDQIHTFGEKELADLGPISHLRLNIYPDGGVSRFRAFGRVWNGK